MTQNNFLHSVRSALTTPSWKRSLFVRRLLAASCLILAIIMSLRANSHSDPEVVIIAKPVAAGAVIQEADLALAAYPRDLHPANIVLTKSEAIGKTVAHPMAPGDPVTSRSFLGTELADALSHTSFGGEPVALVPIKLADPATAALVHPGVPVSVVMSEQGRERVLADDARVVFATSTDKEKLGAGSVLVALPQSTGHAVAAASLENPITVVVQNRTTQPNQ